MMPGEPGYGVEPASAVRHSETMPDVDSKRPACANSATFTVRAGKVRLAARVRVSAVGLLSIGAMVSGILLSTTALVWVATTPVRRHPVATRLGRR